MIDVMRPLWPVDYVFVNFPDAWLVEKVLGNWFP